MIKLHSIAAAFPTSNKLFNHYSCQFSLERNLKSFIFLREIQNYLIELGNYARAFLRTNSWYRYQIRIGARLLIYRDLPDRVVDGEGSSNSHTG